jgi:hypothetical protein
MNSHEACLTASEEKLSQHFVECLSGGKQEKLSEFGSPRIHVQSQEVDNQLLSLGEEQESPSDERIND